MSSVEIQLLLVDDDENDAAAGLRALRDLGLERRVRHFRDGEEALEYIFATGRHAGRQGPLPRAVLLDMNMPKVGGLEVLAALKADPRTRSIAVVMLTGSSRPEDVARSYSLGANSYIVKPTGFEEYAAAIVAAGSYWLTWNQAV